MARIVAEIGRFMLEFAGIGEWIWICFRLLYYFITLRLLFVSKKEEFSATLGHPSPSRWSLFKDCYKLIRYFVLENRREELYVINFREILF